MTTAADTRTRPEPRPWGPLGGAALSAAIFSVVMIFPQVSLIAMFSASPIAVQRLRGTTYGWVALLGATALIGSIFELGSALLFVFVLGIPGFLIGDAMARGRGLRRGCLWAFLFLSMLVTVGLSLYGSEMAAAITKQMQAAAPTSLATDGGLLSPEDAERQLELWQNAVSAVSIVYPAMCIIAGALLVGANALFIHGYLARRDPAWLDGNEFEGIRLPFVVAVVFVIAGGSVLVPALRPVAYNALLIVGFLLALQGLAVVLYYAHRLAGPPLLRAAAVLIIFLSPWPLQILGLLGLFDLWFDFRRFADPPAAT